MAGQGKFVVRGSGWVRRWGLRATKRFDKGPDRRLEPRQRLSLRHAEFPVMARSVLDGLTGSAANLVQLGRREVFLPSFDGGNGGQRSAERLGAVVRRRSAIRHGAVLPARAYPQRVRW